MASPNELFFVACNRVSLTQEPTIAHVVRKCITCGAPVWVGKVMSERERDTFFGGFRCMECIGLGEITRVEQNSPREWEEIRSGLPRKADQRRAEQFMFLITGKLPPSDG